MQNIGGEHRQKIFSTPTGFNKLMFTRQHRVTSPIKRTYLSKNSPTHRQHHSNIMDKRRSTSCFVANSSAHRYSQSMEFLPHHSSNNKINVINLMSFNSTNNVQKSKTNNQNKITLSNVEKYYQFYMKKVNAILNNPQEHDQLESQKQGEQTLDEKLCAVSQNMNQFLRYKEQQKLEYEKMRKSKSFQSDSNTRVTKIKPNWLEICSQGFRRSRVVIVSPSKENQEKLFQSKVAFKPRPTFTSTDKRTNIKKEEILIPVTSKNISNVSKAFKAQKNRSSFVLDAWESSQNVIGDDIF